MLDLASTLMTGHPFLLCYEWAVVAQEVWAVFSVSLFPLPAVNN